MPHIDLAGGARIFYHDDDFSDPWMPVEPMLVLHGCAESSQTYNRWIPALARDFRIIRPDMRGHGGSAPAGPGYRWTVDGIIDDYIALADRLAIDRFHLVGSKLGASLSLRVAARFPERVRTLTAIGPRTRGKEAAMSQPEPLERLEREGVESWARGASGARLGLDCSPEILEGWIRHMGKTDARSLAGLLRMLEQLDIFPDLPHIACPTLVITAEGSALGSVEATRVWQSRIRNSELIVVPTDAYHVAAMEPKRCVAAVRAFIAKSAAVAR